MDAFSHRTPIPPIDLTRITEQTRRALYDAVVSLLFTPTPEEARQAVEDPDTHWFPAYTPDEAGLVVFHAFNRWYAVWRALEENPDEVPPEALWTVLRIGVDPDGVGEGWGSRRGEASASRVFGLPAPRRWWPFCRQPSYADQR